MRAGESGTASIDAARVLTHCPLMWLSADEQTILQYLQHCGAVGASSREICRKASTKDRWKEDERWAMPHIAALKDKSLIEPTGGGFRLPQVEEKKISDL
jgi:hypothetical protein